MGGVVLITLGIIFLLNEFHVRDLNFGNLMPLLLIAIGVVLMLKRTASTEGHVQPPNGPPFPMPPMPSAPPVPGAQPSQPGSEVRHE